MESIQQFLLFVVCMIAVSESYARIGFTGNDMSEAATDIPPFAPEMDNCREACQQKVHIRHKRINEYSSCEIRLCRPSSEYEGITTHTSEQMDSFQFFIF